MLDEVVVENLTLEADADEHLDRGLERYHGSALCSSRRMDLQRRAVADVALRDVIELHRRGQAQRDLELWMRLHVVHWIDRHRLWHSPYCRPRLPGDGQNLAAADGCANVAPHVRCAAPPWALPSAWLADQPGRPARGLAITASTRARSPARRPRSASRPAASLAARPPR